ncbi:restriction endonuclease subunit S [Methanococcoides alaskense]|uniref:Restriction endonuclease S subunit n=1 Tax=Methanococcoides alaskense TaxID=325778 RepID=A0AA90TXF8_9EURY|nr:restriction endonuclease subunit S [Methanococcoides alaskense]MDA0525168.1 restriction endonuclease subunit S [Methanococcoides alaskense]MDR6221911.1 restriction endonuclease S subunit [Methanococcoides alaskense]
MKPYPAYKDSGIEWLGEVPEHWVVNKLGYHTQMIVPMRDKPTFSNIGTPWIRIEDFEGKDISKSKSNQLVSNEVIESMNLKVYPIGTVLCSCSCTMGSTAIVKEPLLSNQTFIGIVPDSKLNSNYLYHLMNASSERLQSLGSGAIQQYLSKENFQNLRLAFPPLTEQQSIGTFLDQKTSQIGALIEKKQKQIELLKEERTAIINQAVTKGLNPDVPMKDSGIEWLGEVPEHWEIKKLKYLANQTREKQEAYGSLKIALENIESWTGKLVNLDSDNAFESEGIVFNEDDVLFGKLRPYLAKVYKAQEAGICVSEILVLRHSNLITSDFLYYRCLSEDFITEVNSSTYGSKMPRANWDFIANLLIPFPTCSEQNLITDLINSTIINSTRMIAKIQSQISFLQEYRTSLISEAVTGKIDVRKEIGVLE